MKRYNSKNSPPEISTQAGPHLCYIYTFCSMHQNVLYYKNRDFWHPKRLFSYTDKKKEILFRTNICSNSVFKQHMDLVKISRYSFENATRLFKNEFLI